MTENTFLVHCDFIIGFNAEGCLIVIVGEFDNITANIEPNSSRILSAISPLSCYHELFAYDIEPNGSVGNFAIPGVLIGADKTTAPCLDQATASTTTIS